MLATVSRKTILIACACAIFWPGSFIFGLPGVLRQYWVQTFQSSSGAVGGVVFLILTGATCSMYLVGRLQEKFGPGLLVAVGAVTCGSSCIWLSQTGSMVEVYIWAFILGASSAFVYLPGLTVVQLWYPQNRGVVSGFFNMAFGLSAAVMSPVFYYLLSKWGFQILTLSVGVAVLVICGVASALIRYPTTDSSKRSSTDGEPPLGRSVGQALKSKEFWCLWLTWVFAGAAGASMLVLATGFGMNRGLILAQAVVLLTAFNLTNGLGRLISGFFSDKIGRSRTMAITFSGAGLAYLIMPHLSSFWIWGILAAVIGFAFGTLFAVSGPLAGDCFGMAHFGSIFSLIFTAYGFVSGPLGPWLSGYILDITQNNYTLVFTYLGLMYLVAAGLILIVQPWRVCKL